MDKKDLNKGDNGIKSPVFTKANTAKDKDVILEEIAVVEDEGLDIENAFEHLEEVEEEVNPNELTAVLKRELQVETTDKEILKKKRQFKGTASTILLALLIITAIMSWFVTGESYDLDSNTTEVVGRAKYGLFDVIAFLEQGFLRDIGGIWFLVIASGAMGVFIRTGAPQAMMQRMKKSHFFTPNRTLVFVMLMISIITTTFNANYLLVAISVFVVPLIVFNGYDIITALMAILFASAAGQMSSIFNSELIGQWIEIMNRAFEQAQSDASATVADGLVFRTITFVLFTVSAIVIVSSYGNKVLNDFDSSDSRRETSKFIQSSSVIFGNAGKAELTTRRKVIMGAFTFTIIISLIGIVQWQEFGFTFFYDLSENWGDKNHWMRFIWGNNMTPLGTWGYLEVSYLFIILSIFVAFMASIPQRKYIQGMTRGINTALNIVLILTLSGALYTMLKTSGLHYTIFYNTLDFFGNTFGDGGVPIGAFLSSIIFSGAFPVTQDLMRIIADVMPRIIIDMSGPSFEYLMLVGTSITIGAGLISIILPTSAITIGLIWAFKIPYNKWVSAVWKSVAIYALVTIPMIIAFTMLLV